MNVYELNESEQAQTQDEKDDFVQKTLDMILQMKVSQQKQHQPKTFQEPGNPSIEPNYEEQV